jgi:hypothetical protein
MAACSGCNAETQLRVEGIPFCAACSDKPKGQEAPLEVSPRTDSASASVDPNVG